MARVERLRKIPAAVRFVSFEPLLERIDTGGMAGIDWVICGAETGPGARHMSQDWALSLLDQCRGYGTKFFMKKCSRGESVHQALDVHEFPDRQP
jgi:protein gp37